jgi:dTMP kinase
MIPPLFLALEGIDGSGKSTQARMLADWLRESGYPVTECRDPGGTELGTHIRELLLNQADVPMSVRSEMLLFMASRAELVEQVIKPARARGEMIISDRFLLSNIVYQGHAGGLDPEQIREVGWLATEGNLPDLTLVFDLPWDVATARRGRAADRLEQRGAEYFARVRAGFLAEAARDPAGIQIVDATQPVEQLHQLIREVILARA